MALADERLGDGVVKLSKEDEEDLAAMNAAIDHMRPFTPADPYLLTIPQEDDKRYHHRYAFQARQWLDNTPFDQYEHESIQYQTFVFHEQSSDMFTLKNSQPLDAVRSAGTKDTADVKVKEKAGTVVSTPNAGAMKKISLGAYMKKQTGQTPDPASAKDPGQAAKKPAAKGPVERLQEDEEVLAAVEEDVSIQAQKQAAAAEEKKDRKRKREEVTEGTTDTKELENKQTQQDAPHDVSELATKKMKLTPPREQHVPTKNVSYAVQPPAEPSIVEEPTPSPPTEEVTDAKLPPKLRSLPQVSDQAAGPKLPPTLPPPSEASVDDKLPRRLSRPTRDSSDDNLPPRQSLSLSQTLPPCLSTAVPVNIIATIKAPGHLRSSSRSSDKSISKDVAGRTLTPPRTQPAKKKSPAPRNGFRANSSSPAVRSDVEDRGRPVTSVPKRMKLPDVDSAEESEEIAVSRKRKGHTDKSRSDNAQPKVSQSEDEKPKEAPSKKSRLLAKLKFKKSAQDRLQALLRMKPTPDKSTSSQSLASKSVAASHQNRRNSGAKGVAQKVKPARTTNGHSNEGDPLQSPPRKRNRSDNSDESDAPLTKRQRASTDASESKRNGLTTPIPSNPLSPSSVPKPTLLPSPSLLRKDTLSVSMKRERSTDSVMLTPSAASQASPGKDGPQPTNGVKPPSSQPTKTPKQQAWEAERKRFQNLGRDLKRVEVAEPKRAAATSLESLLAFVLAFVCADEAALAADPKTHPPIDMWRSMQGYFSGVKKTCEPFPVLLGVACYLGVVFNAHILNLAAQHSPESSGAKFLETQAMMQRAANEAESKLDLDTLQDTFPRTWARREKGVLGHAALEPGKYKVSYKLPLGIQTSPLRAVRAAHAMLEEWLEKQRELDHAMKLKL